MYSNSHEGSDYMKLNATKKQEQNNQAQHKDQPILRVRSGLRAGAANSLIGGCCPEPAI